MFRITPLTYRELCSVSRQEQLTIMWSTFYLIWSNALYPCPKLQKATGLCYFLLFFTRDIFQISINSISVSCDGNVLTFWRLARPSLLPTRLHPSLHFAFKRDTGTPLLSSCTGTACMCALLSNSLQISRNPLDTESCWSNLVYLTSDQNTIADYNLLCARDFPYLGSESHNFNVWLFPFKILRLADGDVEVTYYPAEVWCSISPGSALCKLVDPLKGIGHRLQVCHGGSHLRFCKTIKTVSVCRKIWLCVWRRYHKYDDIFFAHKASSLKLISL